MSSPISVSVKWNGNSYPIKDINLELSVKELKLLIAEQTNVLPTRQKLLNLKCKGMFVTYIYFPWWLGLFYFLFI